MSVDFTYTGGTAAVHLDRKHDGRLQGVSQGAGWASRRLPIWAARCGCGLVDVHKLSVTQAARMLRLQYK